MTTKRYIRITLLLINTAVILTGSSTAYAQPADLPAAMHSALGDFDEGQRIQTMHPDRARRLFLSAAQRYSSIIAAGVHNGYIEFNLGNCYLQAGDVGNAIVHYLRARQYIPRDPLLADNLSVARSRRLLSIQTSQSDAFVRSLFFWHYQTSTIGRLRTLLFFYFAFWAMLTMRHFIPKRSVTIMACILAGLTVVLGCSVMTSHWSQRKAPIGVVTTMDVVVQKGPGSGYRRQFEQPLQPGVEFTLLQQRGEWMKIELPDSKAGWIESDLAKLVPEIDSPE